MDRLAEWTGEEWIARQERLNGKIVGNSMCMKRLAAYEDLGITPEQIQEIDKLYAEKCREVAELKKKQTPMKPIKNRTQNIRYTSAYSCPNCGGGFTGTGIADYCYHCGQKLDWVEPYSEDSL